jgi:hypothetical protein
VVRSVAEVACSGVVVSVSVLWSSVPVIIVIVVGSGCGGGLWLDVVVCVVGIVAGGVVGGCGVVVDGGDCVGGVVCGVGMHFGGGCVDGAFWMGVEGSGMTCIGVGGVVGGVVLTVWGSRLPSKALTVPTPSFCPARCYFHLSILSHLGFLRPSCHPYQLAKACGVLPYGILPIYYGILTLRGIYYILCCPYVCG